MQNTLLVMRHEINTMIRSAGYIISAFLVPVVVALILLGMSSLNEPSGIHSGVDSATTRQSEINVEGYVDRSGLIRQVPENIPVGQLLSFESEELANQALETGAITAYYLIPPDVLAGGKVYYVYPNTRSYLDDGQPWVMAWTVIFNLLDGDAKLAERVGSPVTDISVTDLDSQPQAGGGGSEDCARPGGSCASNDLVRFMPSIMAALFFAAFMVSSSRLFNSIGTEKENRMLEVLMLSVSPRQLLAGKTLGLGALGVIQIITWLAVIFISFTLAGQALQLPDNFEFPIDILIWGLVFFLGGYGLYAGLMAGAGALVPKMKEAGAANYIALIPLFFGYVFSIMAPLTKTADSAFLVFLSLFPLTSPVVMVMRLTNNQVPIWQPALAVGLLFITGYFALRAVAAMFHAQNLLSGQPFSIRRYVGALVGSQ